MQIMSTQECARSGTNRRAIKNLVKQSLVNIDSPSRYLVLSGENLKINDLHTALQSSLPSTPRARRPSGTWCSCTCSSQPRACWTSSGWTGWRQFWAPTPTRQPESIHCRRPRCWSTPSPECWLRPGGGARDRGWRMRGESQALPPGRSPGDKPPVRTEGEKGEKHVGRQEVSQTYLGQRVLHHIHLPSFGVTPR